MDKKTEQTMIANLELATRKSLDHWISIARTFKGKKHKEVVTHLKNEYELGLFFADLIVHKANGTDAGSLSHEELIVLQYKGKEHLKPTYDAVLSVIQSFGNDIEVAPKKSYVSLRRKKQFCCLKPAAKNRFEIELILKGIAGSELLQPIIGAGAMCTHRINIPAGNPIGEDVYEWIKVAYDRAI